MKHTRHSRTRSGQRAISDDYIEIALSHGKPSHSYGDMAYTLDDRSLLGTPFQSQTGRLRGLSVVVTRDGHIRTVKWVYHLRKRRPALTNS